MFGCIYCYAQSFSNVPVRKKVFLYTNLMPLLKKQLFRIHTTSLNGVIFNTASDCFQPHPDIINITYKAMELLLLSRIPIYFLTKGIIPQHFFPLFYKYKDLVNPSIGLAPFEQKMASIFEPYAPLYEERLNNIIMFNEIGIIPSIRLDPLIPFFNDTKEILSRLFEQLSSLSITHVTVSYLHLRPALEPIFRKLLPEREKLAIELMFPQKEYKKVGTSTKAKLIPKVLREKGYNRVKDIANSFGINIKICTCKNPDMPGERCFSPSIIDVNREERRQLLLFNEQ